MAQRVSTVITNIHDLPVPAEVRERLGIVEGSTVTFVLDENEVRILPATSSIKHLSRSVKPLPETSEDFGIEIEEAMQDAADNRIKPQRSR